MGYLVLFLLDQRVMLELWTLALVAVFTFLAISCALLLVCLAKCRTSDVSARSRNERLQFHPT